MDGKGLTNCEASFTGNFFEEGDGWWKIIWCF